MTSQRAGRPALGGSLVYLVSNLPVGIAGFVVLVTLLSVTVSTAIVWVGLPVGAATILLARGAGRLERERVRALLGRYVPMPHRPLPDDGWRARWRTRLGDSATWRDIVYFLLLFPIGIAQFVIVVTTWAVSLGLATLPIYYRFLPEGAYYFPDYSLRWLTVDSTLSALPWAGLGVLLLAVTVPLTRLLAEGHARFAASLLGPTAARDREVTDSPRTTPESIAVAG